MGLPSFPYAEVVANHRGRRGKEMEKNDDEDGALSFSPHLSAGLERARDRVKLREFDMMRTA